MTDKALVPDRGHHVGTVGTTWEMPELIEDWGPKAKRRTVELLGAGVGGRSREPHVKLAGQFNSH